MKSNFFYRFLSNIGMSIASFLVAKSYRHAFLFDIEFEDEDFVSTPKKEYRLIQKEVDVIRWTGNNIKEVEKFLEGTAHMIFEKYGAGNKETHSIYLLTTATRQTVNLNNYIVKDSDNHCNSYPERVFFKNYERNI